MRLEAIRDVVAGFFESPSELNPEGQSQAAVAAVFVEEHPARGAELLLIRRANHPSDPWAGDLALPGGRRDPDDARLQDTVTREVMEELGVDLPQRGSYLGALPAVQARARGKLLAMSVRPYVFVLNEKPALVLNHEVDLAYFEPIGPLVLGQRAAQRSYLHAGKEVPMPAWQVREGLVWGLTYQMLRPLFERLRG